MKWNNLTHFELNALIGDLTWHGRKIRGATHWQRNDVGSIEVYVGDRKFIISITDERPKTKAELDRFFAAARDTVCRYLESEDFVDAKYLYIWLQRVRIAQLPDLTDEDQ